ncbi:MAG TPA: short-chain dehydrogenase, partial [Gammaproteobacteria bacterium]|nr:short-chain dehydrogenase [Gammaproteobacteria bacterium]
MSAVPPDYLKGRIAVVTGGCGGIGRAICQRFHAEGAVVYATDIAAFEFPESNIHVLHHDVGSEEDANAVMAHVEAEHGRLDILVNAAGIEIEKTIEDTTLEEWNHSFSVNVNGTFLTSKRALPLLRNAGSGSIINFGSYDGFIADPSLAVYCATKGAV